jgi:hypothetical protein
MVIIGEILQVIQMLKEVVIIFGIEFFAMTLIVTAKRQFTRQFWCPLNCHQRLRLCDVAVFEIQLLPNVQKPNRIK